MYSIAKIEELIRFAESTLIRYEKELNQNPKSLFCKGMVLITSQRLAELRNNIVFEKQKREKEIIDLRLKGKLARVGKLPLELLGGFAKNLSETFIEIGRQNQFGNKTGKNYTNQIKNSIDLRFDRIVAGSTHIIITGKTNPDLFGNSILENSLENTFELLNATSDQLLDVSNKIGGSGIKKVNKIMALAVDNDLEFDLEWEAPNTKVFKWFGDTEKIKSIFNSISKVQIDDPLDVEIQGKIITLSLKGIIEIKEDDKKMYKINYPLSMLEKVKSHQIGDLCTIICSQKSSKNKITEEEKISFELKEIITN